MIVTAFFRAVNQLGDRSFLKVMFRSVLLTGLSFVGVALLAAWGLSSVWSWIGLPFSIFFSTVGSVFVFFVGMWMLGPAVAISVNSMFLSEIIRAVEYRFYPHDEPGKDLKVFDEVRLGARFFLTLISLNILLIPLVFSPPLYFLFYWAINVYLISREYFETVGFRLSSRKEADVQRKISRLPLFIYGLITSVLFTIPILNFFTPLIAAAAMVHIYKNISE